MAHLDPDDDIQQAVLAGWYELTDDGQSRFPHITLVGPSMIRLLETVSDRFYSREQRAVFEAAYAVTVRRCRYIH
jgi:hypothetical protein